MPAPVKVLLVGESWSVQSQHNKGFDAFSTTHYEVGTHYLEKALKDSPVELTHMPAHVAQTSFPYHADELSGYDVLCLSDIGVNTLLLPAETFIRMERRPNRLHVIHDYVKAGGSLLMCGGYLSFQGIHAEAAYHQTVIERILPVTMSPHDDRYECPEGVVPEVTEEGKAHPMLQWLTTPLPYLLGFNRVQAKPDAQVLARFPQQYQNFPLLVVGSYEGSRVAAFTSDIAPHWLPPDFCHWPGYRDLWVNLFSWLGQR